MELQGMGKQGFSEVNALIKFPQFPIHYGGRHWSPLGAENWLSGLKAWLWVLTSLLRTEHPLDFQTVKSCRPLPRKGPSENMTWRKRDLASLALPQHDQVPCSSDEILIVDSESPTTNYLSCFERRSFLTLNPKLSGRLVFLFFFHPLSKNRFLLKHTSLTVGSFRDPVLTLFFRSRPQVSDQPASNSFCWVVFFSSIWNGFSLINFFPSWLFKRLRRRYINGSTLTRGKFAA